METMNDKILTVINKLRPYLQRDGGDLEFVRFDAGVVYVRLLGACVRCHGAEDTLEMVEEILMEEVAGIIEVKDITM